MRSTVAILHRLLKFLVSNTQLKTHIIILARYGQRFTTERLLKVTTNSESTTSNVAQQLKPHNVTDEPVIANNREYLQSGNSRHMLTLAA